MAFLDKQYPDNRQKAPEQVRPYSALASEVFRNNAYPQNHAAADNLKYIVETISAPEYFTQAPVGPEQSGAMGALTHSLLQNQISDTPEDSNV